MAKSGFDLDALRNRAKDSLDKHGGFDDATFQRLASQLRYVDGDYQDPKVFQDLGQALGDAKRPLAYLAIPPTLFGPVVEGLARMKCAEDGRVVVEKPFGRDLASARALNHTLHAHFPEEAIYRIDHYLGKEPVENLVYFRCSNSFVEGSWRKKHVECIQITMAENFGVQGRGKFFEETGAIRDVVQNHMLQVISCLGMELPAGGEVHESVRNERSNFLKAVRTLDPADVVRGQFRGYRQEPGVAPDSQIETAAVVRFHVDNERWEGVPFYVRVGKCLPVRATEVLVRLKLHPAILDETSSPPANEYRFRLSPDIVIALGVNAKKPGDLMVGERIELVAHHRLPDEMEPYERLLGDAVNGDPSLFVTEEADDEAWRIVDPILGAVTPVEEYEPNTWGPKLPPHLTPPGGWHDPLPPDVAK